MMRGERRGGVFAVSLQKGGVGKTTTTLNLGAALAELGARVLLVDLDPQANLTIGLGVSPECENSSYEVLLNPGVGVDFAVVPTHGVDLVPATLALAGAEAELSGVPGRELLLREALTVARDKYDYIFIDTPPSLGLFTLNALAAADAVLVPLQVHAYAFKSMPQLEATIKLVHRLNPGLAIGGIVCTMTDRRNNLSTTVEEKIRAKYPELVFAAVIPTNITLASAPAAGEPIKLFAPNSVGARAYAALASELDARYAAPKEMLDAV